MKIEIAVKKFLDHVNGDNHHRYLSWDHCHKTFAKYKDSLALELAFYLASWGMYRGSSGLLQKNHHVHHCAVDIIFSDKYRGLYCNESRDISLNDLNKILELKQELSTYYSNIEYRKGNTDGKNIGATDTLISKVMLGTLGCVPAYDRYFKDGLKIMKLNGRSFNKRSLEELFKFIEDNDNEIKSAQQTIKKEIRYHYPKMKIVDMYFWLTGFDAS